MKSNLLIDLHFFPSVQFFTKLLLFETITLEQHEHYNKGSYRNRCYLQGANGLVRLSVPLKQGKNQRQIINTVSIAYEEHWQSEHWTTICSAYNNAPFFDFYRDAFQPFFKKRYDSLFDYNLDILKTCIQMIGLDETKLKLSESYLKPEELPENTLDFRSGIHPKAKYQLEDIHFKAFKYPQVFEDRHGFMPNLSILDLIFCAGPQTIEILDLSTLIKKHNH